MMMKRIFLYSVLLCLTAFMLFLSFNIHSKSGYFNYHSEIWADKAGYYVYLPAALKYGFNPDQFPDSIDVKTGKGFQLDYMNGKVRTKYNYGVALMQLPFYLIADFLANPLGQERNAFSPVYHWSLNVAAVFYLMAGMLLLGLFLKKHFRKLVVWLVLFSILAGTNLFYYSMDETGMSHVYSFFLFSLFLYLLQQTGFLQRKFTFQHVMLSFVAGLILVIRPSNFLFLLFAFFLFAGNKEAGQVRIRYFFRPAFLFASLLIVLLVFLPQFLYWNYLHDSFIVYTYKGEGFSWLQPAITTVLFAPRNGLFLYNPFFLVILASFVIMIKKNQWNGSLISLLFIVLLYVVSSWWDPTFGCSFGARNFVEYTAVFSFPLAHLYQRILQQKILPRLLIWLVILLLILVNLKLTYTYDDCFFGSGTWDWQEYLRLLLAPTA